MPHTDLDRPQIGLQIRGLSRTFGEVVALRDVNLEIKPGEVVGLLGPNGCGKTTLIQCLVGLISQDEGEILWEGEWAGNNELSFREALGWVKGTRS